ncbi:MAG: hypothetical protein MPK62_00880 [Alphaproteobacteria bacterium]|nr:hypothetical protein [Alphaproteobacteria bacterium]MDA8029688.1 hypothetical protein [Alphaproteobacteria bacterium]
MSAPVATILGTYVTRDSHGPAGAWVKCPNCPPPPYMTTEDVIVPTVKHPGLNACNLCGGLMEVPDF